VLKNKITRKEQFCWNT